MGKRLALLLASLALAGLVLAVPTSAHPSLRSGRYECWLTAITQYSNYDLKIMSGGRYAFMLETDTTGKAGEFRHDGDKIRFTSGYLKKKGYTGEHLADGGTHIIYLYKNGDMKYDCNNN